MGNSKNALKSPEKISRPALATVPRHVGIIMDGNGRWAKAKKLPRTMGHRQGAENLRHILEAAVDFGIEILTIYAFSTENWNRPKSEVKGLMNLFHYYFDRELDELAKNGVQLRHVGHMAGMSLSLQKKIRKAVEQTKNNNRLILNVAFNYGGRSEIVHAVQAIIKAGIPPEQVTESLFSRYLYTGGQPDPDLIIRTSGELRTSNFLPWQAAYAEYYITPVYWPDFNEAELYKALLEFNRRKRRFGGLNSDE